MAARELDRVYMLAAARRMTTVRETHCYIPNETVLYIYIYERERQLDVDLNHWILIFVLHLCERSQDTVFHNIYILYRIHASAH